MFQRGDEVISKWTGQRGIVRDIIDDETMVIEYKDTKFRKGNLRGYGITALIKNFEKAV